MTSTIIITMDATLRQMGILNTGQLVEIKVNDKLQGTIPFVTVGHRGTCDVLYQFIDLNSWPSWNDFTGDITVVHEGDLATIMRFIGKPIRIDPKDSWHAYDVYEILIQGNLRQVFRCNLDPYTFPEGHLLQP